ncbi:hypothetical protein PPERSA_12544 [Pseudocohnilembus persalinus]|uniref:Uncharacterized protein n=1 Tax=Pseudocohnilembus persalinus TaxID=266149 RepID=A0A0V0QB71_PSEPJ|nr:hypothetical protein PPERSA_12544 [Pseudocohnilembus persalinus]|eukprot:KRW99440.1 hypothetical protein PPERSA_12544 [Pseudocohnilembus persalinus]
MENEDNPNLFQELAQQDQLENKDKNEPHYVQETEKMRRERIMRKMEQMQSTQQKFTVQNTRQLDNHYDNHIHQKHWIAPGLQKKGKYNYTKDSGLGHKINTKEEQKLEEQRAKLEEQKKNGIKNYHNGKYFQFRNYKELDNCSDEEVVVTIEYCTNCSKHNSTTRHDEQKYLNQALSLQKEILKSFRIVTVYLKPNVYDERDKSVDTLYVRQRLGAFEVQISGGMQEIPLEGQPGQFRQIPKKGVLHSKLKTGTWPDHPSILSQIRYYMPKSNIQVTLNLEDFDLNEVDPKQFKNAKVNKLYEIEVTLRPKREKVSYEGKSLSQLQQQQISGISRPSSAVSKKSQRPLSGVSNKSKQSGQQVVQEYDTSKDKIIGKTNSDGTLIFEEVPYDVYYLEIEETNEFKGIKEVIDIFEYKENGEPLDFEYNLRHQNLTFLKLMCQWGVEASEDEKQAIKTIAGNQEDQFMLPRGPLDKAQLEVIPIRDGEEIEEEMYDDVFNGVSEITLLPKKQYRIKIVKAGYQPLDQLVELQAGVQELEFCVEKDPNYKPAASSKKNSQKQNNQQFGQFDQQSPQLQQQAINKPVRPVSSSNKILDIYTYDGATAEPLENVQIEINEKKMNRASEINKTGDDGICKIQLNNVLEGNLKISKEGYIPLIEPYGPQKFDLTKQKELNFPLFKQAMPNQIIIRVIQNSDEKILTLKLIDSDNQVIDESTNDIEIDNNFDTGTGFISINNVKYKKGIFRIYAVIEDYEKFDPSLLRIFVLNENDQKALNIPRIKTVGQDQAKIWDIGFINGFNQEQKLNVYDDVQQNFAQIANSLDKYGFPEVNGLVHLFASAQQSSGMYSFQQLNNKLKAVTTQNEWDVEEQQQQDDL